MMCLASSRAPRSWDTRETRILGTTTPLLVSTQASAMKGLLMMGRFSFGRGLLMGGWGCSRLCRAWQREELGVRS